MQNTCVELLVLKIEIEKMNKEEYDSFLMKGYLELIKKTKSNELQYRFDPNHLIHYYTPIELLEKHKYEINWTLFSDKYEISNEIISHFSNLLSWNVNFLKVISEENLIKFSDKFHSSSFYHIQAYKLNNKVFLKDYCNEFNWHTNHYDKTLSLGQQLTKIIENYEICKECFNDKKREEVRKIISSKQPIPRNIDEQHIDYTQWELERCNIVSESIGKVDNLFNTTILSHGIFTKFKSNSWGQDEYYNIITNFNTVLKGTDNLILSCSAKNQRLGPLGFYLMGENIVLSNIDILSTNINGRIYYDKRRHSNLITNKLDYVLVSEDHAEHLIKNYKIIGVWFKKDALPMYYNLYVIIKNFCHENKLVFHLIEPDPCLREINGFNKHLRLDAKNISGKCPICGADLKKDYNDLDECNYYCTRCYYFDKYYYPFEKVIGLKSDELEVIKNYLSGCKIVDGQPLDDFFLKFKDNLNPNSDSDFNKLIDKFIGNYLDYYEKMKL